ncbi:aminopeptidase, partial [Vibrio alginolyticus]|nr:aminopeptidase [Vibrio alginolyticus]
MQAHMTTRRTLIAAAVSATLLSGCYFDDPRWVAEHVSQAIEQDEVVDHLQTLEGLASPTSDNSGITRAAGSQGYQESVDYIIATMKAHGYKVTTQEFDFRAWEELANTHLTVNGSEL